MTERYDGEETINGKKYFKHYGFTSGELVSYDRKAKEGLFKVPVDNKDKPEELTVPLFLKVGETHTIKRESAPKSLTIETTLLGKEAVTIADKKYENCLKFSKKYSHAGGDSKPQDMELIEYYAPNIGMVKSIRNIGKGYKGTLTLTNYANEKKQNFSPLSRVLNIFAGFGKKSSRIEGKWVPEVPTPRTDDIAIEFFPDKTAIYQCMSDGSLGNFSAKWNIYDDGRIKLDVVFRGGTLAFMGALENDKINLDLRSVTRGVVIFVRAK